MTLRIVGAGLGRTGTNSLKLALEQLLGAPCYHMYELMQNASHLPAWEAAVAGADPDWDGLLGTYRATVDWPAAAFWREIRAANPDALVLLSTRDSPEAWWASMERTIVRALSTDVPPGEVDWARRRRLTREIMRTRFTPNWDDPSAAMAAYEAHNDAVRDEVPAHLLLDWRTGDGWPPICAALGLEVPSQPFPHENRTADFEARLGISGDE